MKKLSKTKILNFPLEPMPLDEEDILEGNPRAKGEILFSSADKKFYMGVWECTKGKFLYKYDDDEACYILQGEAIIRSDSGVVAVRKGDFVFFRKGLETMWQIKKKIKKLFFIYES